jgi:hypothetical protein
MSINTTIGGTPDRGNPKKPYARPQVLSYGSVHEITQSADMHTKNDNGGIPGNPKTA